MMMIRSMLCGIFLVQNSLVSVRVTVVVRLVGP